ncbi:MAG: putative viral replication protein [Cressdnaviricota sp.]|nr:MAG: putative viral replication protein [Cressdnaviricota sp.]
MSDTLETMETLDLGNTSTKSNKKKRVIPTKKWLCTLFNMKMETAVEIFQVGTTKGVIGAEICPTTGREHLQCYFVFNTKIRANETYKLLKGHWEKAKGTDEDNYRYCTKDNRSREWGHFPILSEIYKLCYSDLRDSQKEIVDMFKTREHPKYGRKIYWFWEKTGNWGKSITATYMVDRMNAIIVSGGKKDILFGVGEMCKDGNAPPIVVVDIPRVSKDGLSIAAIESVKNGLFFNEKYEGGMIRFARPHIICFANQPPPLEKMSADRWVVRRLCYKEVWDEVMEDLRKYSLMRASNDRTTRDKPLG